MTDSNSAAKINFLVLAVGKFVYNVSQWVILLILARIGGAAELGRFSLALSIVSPVFLFASMQLPNLVAVNQDGRRPLSAYIQLNRWLLITATLLFSLGTVLFVSDRQMQMLMLALALMKVMEGMSDIRLAEFQKRQQFFIVGASYALKGVLSAVCFAAAFVWTDDLAMAAVAITTVRVVLFFAFDKFRFDRLPDRFGDEKTNVSDLRSMFLAVVPMGFALLLDCSLTMVPRYVVEYFHDEAAVGYLSAVVSVSFVFGAALVVIRQALAPILGQAYANGDLNRYSLLLNGTAAGAAITGGIFTALSWLWGEQILWLFFGPDYTWLQPHLVLFGVAMVFGFPAHILMVGLTVQDVLGRQPFNYALALATCLITLLMFVPEQGVYGACLSAVFSWAVLCLSNLYVQRTSFLAFRERTMIAPVTGVELTA